MPTSTVEIPSLVAAMGPMVEPHGSELFYTNACTATPAFWQTPFHSALPRASVA